MEKLIVNSAQPIRLDRYLRRHYPHITQGIIEKALRKGDIKLNEEKAKTSARVVQGDSITLRAEIGVAQIEQQSKSSTAFSKNIIVLAKKLLSDYLLFSSDDFIAIDKPEGLAVQGGSKISLSVDDALRYLNHKEGTQYKLVHRLDKDTSGVLLIANGFDNAAKLGEAFAAQTIKKIYIAILSGCPEAPEGDLQHSIGKDRSGIFEVVKELATDGKIAKTHYKVLKSTGSLSLVEFRPATGRMHQLRFHSQFLGCPIVGDEKYGGKKNHRMLLHAKNITIPSEVFGRKISIDSYASEEFDL